jgi:hypothetical protein
MVQADVNYRRRGGGISARAVRTELLAHPL